jgi:hypothetical protein
MLDLASDPLGRAKLNVPELQARDETHPPHRTRAISAQAEAEDH